MIQQDEAIAKIHSSSPDSSGASCKFYKVNDSFGAKVYTDITIASKNMDAQRSLYNLGFAPEVLSDVIKLMVKEYGQKVHYMFLTELAKTVYQVCVEDGSACKFCRNHCKSSKCKCNSENVSDIRSNWMEKPQFKDIADLQKRMIKQGYYNKDRLWVNYGYLKDGTPVIIDCDFYHRNNYRVIKKKPSI